MKKKRWRPAMCECGRGPKEYGYTAKRGHRELVGCWYCNQLDGKTKEERDVINVLRSVSGGLGVDAVAGELNQKYNTAQVGLLRMVKRGRIRTVSVFEDETWNHSVQREYRLAPTHSRGNR